MKIPEGRGVVMAVSGGGGGGGGGSLRDVLLTGGGRGGAGGGGSSQGGGGLTWRTLRSVSGTADAVDPRGYFFPAKLALSLGLLKLLLALLMVAMGIMALVLHAALSTLGAGLWAGAIVGLSGFLGVCASRRPYAHVYVVSFMCVAILSMASSGLLIIMSATAWARDDQHPTAVFVDQDTQEEVEVLGEVVVRRPAVLVSGALVLLGVVDCIVSLACITVSAREACGLYNKADDRAQGLSEGHNRKERLYRWLGQQKTIFPISPPRGVSSISQFVPLSSSDSSSSATPRKTSTDPTTESSLPTHRLNHQTSNRPTTTPSHLPPYGKGSGGKSATESVPSILKASDLRITSGSHSLPPQNGKHHNVSHTHERHHSAHLHMQVAYPHFQHPLPPHQLQVHHLHANPHAHHIPQKIPTHPHHHTQKLQTHQHFPAHATHPSLYYPHLVTPMMPHYPTDKDHQLLQRQKKKDGKKCKNRDGKKEKKKTKKNKKELTDEQIERTYTGLDREIAEEFIDSTMEPGISIQKAFNNNSFEQDSF